MRRDQSAQMGIATRVTLQSPDSERCVARTPAVPCTALLLVQPAVPALPKRILCKAYERSFCRTVASTSHLALSHSALATALSESAQGTRARSAAGMRPARVEVAPNASPMRSLSGTLSISVWNGFVGGG